MDTVILIMAGVGLVFWIWQLVAVAFTDGRFIKRPLDKLLWFLIVAFGNVLGATVFFAWKRWKKGVVTTESREAEALLLTKADASAWSAEQPAAQLQSEGAPSD